MRKKKILYLGQAFPYPPDSGGRIKTLNTLRMLATTYEVHAVFISEEHVPEKSKEYIKNLGIKAKVFYKPDILRSVVFDVLTLIKNYIHGVPHIVYKYYDEAIARFINKEIQDFDPDVIHACHISMSQYVRPIQAHRLYLLELENIESQLQWSRFCYTRALLRRLYVLIEGVLVWVYEWKKFRLFDHIFCICKEDKILIHTIFRLSNATVQTPVVPARYTPRAVQSPPRILFVGMLGWPPNEDAVEWFVSRVLPIIIKKLPHVEFHIVGRPFAPLMRLMRHAPNITYHGFQKSLLPLLKSAGVFVLPFRMGGGIKLKALTAFAHGVPVVSTPMGVRGYSVEFDKDCLVATNPEQFAQKTIRVLTDPILADQLSRRVYQYAQMHHGNQQNTQFIQQYGRLVGSQQQRV